MANRAVASSRSYAHQNPTLAASSRKMNPGHRFFKPKATSNVQRFATQEFPLGCEVNFPDHYSSDVEGKGLVQGEAVQNGRRMADVYVYRTGKREMIPLENLRIVKTFLDEYEINRPAFSSQRGRTGSSASGESCSSSSSGYGSDGRKHPSPSPRQSGPNSAAGRLDFAGFGDEYEGDLTCSRVWLPSRPAAPAKIEQIPPPPPLFIDQQQQPQQQHHFAAGPSPYYYAPFPKPSYVNVIPQTQGVTAPPILICVDGCCAYPPMSMGYFMPGPVYA